MSSASASSEPSRLVAIPMLAEMLNRRPAISNGSANASATRVAIAIASSRPWMRSSSSVNSSPPSRASTSWVRITLLEPARDLREQQVADAVAERVVHDLEAVDVEVQHADRRAVALRVGRRPLQALHERGAVREPGEVVARRLQDQTRVGLAQLHVGVVVAFLQLQLADHERVHVVVQRRHHDEVDRDREREQHLARSPDSEERDRHHEQHRHLAGVVVQAPGRGADHVRRRRTARRRSRYTARRSVWRSRRAAR